MSITGMAGRVIRVYRRTASVIDVQPVLPGPAMSLDRDLQDPAVLEITMSGGFGPMFVSGSVAGAPTVEVVAFSGAGNETQRTINVWDSISSISLPAFVGFDISVNAIGVDGSRIYVHYVVMKAVRMHLNHGVPYWLNPKEGTSQLQDVWFGIDYTTAWTPREGDVFHDWAADLQFMVTGTPEYLGSIRPHHWEVKAKRRAGTIQI